jgi:polysaccharide biosynthesis transport protein
MVNERLSTPENYPQSEGDGFDFRQYLYLLWDRAWLILLVALLAGAAAFFISQRMTPLYQTTTKLLVVDAASTKTTDYTSLLASERLTSTYSDMLTNEAVLLEVIQRNKIQMNTTELAKMVKAAPVRDTQLIMVTVEGADPALIAKIANTMVQVLIERMNKIQSERYSSSEQNLQVQLKEIEKVIQDTQDKISITTDAAEKERLDSQSMQYRQIYANLLTNYEQSRLAEAQSSSSIVQVNEALPPLKPFSPKILQNTILAMLGAMLLMIAGVFVADGLDDSLKTPAQVNSVLGLPVLGVVFKHKNGNGPISQDQPYSPVSEAFRSLRTNIQYAHIDGPLNTLMVTSPSPQEGKTQVSLNLATVLAQGGRQVILLDADLRRPMVHKRLSIPNVNGVTGLLLKPDMDLELVAQKSKTDGLRVITAGEMPPNPAELLGSQVMEQILRRLKDQADILLLDTPPLLPITDAAVLGAMVDGVLLVVQPGLTTITTAKQAVTQLKRVNANILGVVLNNVEINSSRNNYYYHRSYHYYRQNEKKTA